MNELNDEINDFNELNDEINDFNELNDELNELNDEIDEFDDKLALKASDGPGNVIICVDDECRET